MQPHAVRRLGARMSDFENRYVSVGGVRTRYWQAGSAGSPVILLHGIGCSVLEWHANITALASRHRVYAVDFLGCGLTERPSDETYTVPRLAQFVLDFLSANAIQRAHFAGFSLGGRIALECALVAPERVSSMVLVAPAGIARDGTLIHLRLASVPLVRRNAYTTKCSEHENTLAPRVLGPLVRDGGSSSRCQAEPRSLARGKSSFP